LYGYYLMAMGRQTESIEEMNLALELDPLSLIINGDLGMAYYFACQLDQAIQQLRKTVEMDPSFAQCHAVLGWAYEQKGMYVEAIAELNKARILSGGWARVVAELGYADAASDQRDEARDLLQELKDPSRPGYIDPANISLIYTGLGEKDEALQWLQKAYEEQSPWIPWLKVEPNFDALRSDPRFVGLLQSIGLAS
jgi:tetratricopeptide (TPR) repeat protein